jgi:hypothetical protein
MRKTPRRQLGQGKGRRKMSGQILDISAASIFLGITEKTLRSRVSRGLIPYRRWSGRIVFLRQELEDFFLKTLPGISLEQAQINEKARH